MFIDISFLDCVGLGFLEVMFATIFAWNRIYASIKSGCTVGAFQGVSRIFNGLCNWHP